MRELVLPGLLAWAASIVLAGSSARAEFGPVDFNPNPGRGGTTLPIWGFNQGAGNLLLKDALSAIKEFNAAPTQPHTFQAYYQSTAMPRDQNGAGIFLDNDLGKTYELKVVASLTYEVTGASFYPDGHLASATFVVAPTQRPDSFFRVYQGPVTANPLAGTGFTDGTQILSGTLVAPPGGGAVTLNVANQTSPLDANLNHTNSWLGTKTLINSGGSPTIAVPVTSLNTNFFPNTDLQKSSVMLQFTSTLTSPYREQFPSHQFTAKDGSPITANIGGTNILIGPDIMLQARGSSGFQLAVVPEPSTFAVVPEPSAFVLTGLGLLGVLMALRRRTAT